MFRQKTSGNVERANRVPCAVEKLSWCRRAIHHSHVVRAAAVVEERERMKQETTAFACKRAWQLRDDGLRFAAHLVAKHDHDVAGRVCDCLSCLVDRTRFDSGLLRGE